MHSLLAVCTKVLMVGWFLSACASASLSHKMALWKKLQTPQHSYSFEEGMTFLANNSLWPRRSLIQQRAEESLHFNLDSQIVVKWFQKYPPLTSQGATHYILALQKTGQNKKAKQEASNAWRKLHFTVAQEAYFSKKFNKLLTKEDQTYHLYKMGFESNVLGLKANRWMNPSLVDAVIGLIKNAPSITQKVKKARNHPLLFFHRIKWRLSKDIDTSDLMLATIKNKDDLLFPEQWALLKKRAFKQALKRKKYVYAYKIISQHHTSSGFKAADAEFFAGWVSLRFLKAPTQALKHFQKFNDYATSPILKAKAAYWLGQTYAHLKQKEKSIAAYQKGTLYPLTFYGQRCFEILKKPLVIHLKSTFLEVPPTGWDEIVNVISLLKNDPKTAEIFLTHLIDRSHHNDERAFVLSLAKKYAPQSIVICSKYAAQKGLDPLHMSYPLLSDKVLVDVPPSLSKDLLHAVIWQESGFNPTAKSSVGACGMMQIMPKTAREISKWVGKSFSHHRLSHPLFNIHLGSTYFAKMLHIFAGDEILALTSYNAGIGTVKQWIKDYGDPRGTDVDILDWIEMIPFDETRSYIYRILEARPIYEKLRANATKK